MPDEKELTRQIGVLNSKIFVLERIVDELIEAFNSHDHIDAGFGLKEVNNKLRRRLKGDEWVLEQ